MRNDALVAVVYLDNTKPTKFDKKNIEFHKRLGEHSGFKGGNVTNQFSTNVQVIKGNRFQ